MGLVLFLSSVLIVGMAGSGKSSLVRVLCNESNAIVSSDGEGTLKSTLYNCGLFNLIDTPGFGTKQFPMISSNTFFAYNVGLIIMVVNHRLYTQHHEFMDRYFGCTHGKIPLVVVRSQTDIFPLHNDSLDLIKSELYNVPEAVIGYNQYDLESHLKLKALITHKTE